MKQPSFSAGTDAGSGGDGGRLDLGASRELAALIKRRGKPGMIVSDNGMEVTSKAILRWCSETRVERHGIVPSKPMQSGFVESFNGRMRMGCSTKPCSAICLTHTS